MKKIHIGEQIFYLAGIETVTKTMVRCVYKQELERNSQLGGRGPYEQTHKVEINQFVFLFFF